MCFEYGDMVRSDKGEPEEKQVKNETGAGFNRAGSIIFRLRTPASGAPRREQAKLALFAAALFTTAFTGRLRRLSRAFFLVNNLRAAVNDRSERRGAQRKKNCQNACEIFAHDVLLVEQVAPFFATPPVGVIPLQVYVTSCRYLMNTIKQL